MTTSLWARLPDAPGVYLMLDARGRVLYVGRSVSLRARVRSYWSSPDPYRAHLQPMLRRVRRVEHVVCETEHAAAFLERDLIAKHAPPFNLTPGVETEWWLRFEPAPGTLTAVREPGADGARYFGPFLGGRRVRLALAALRRLKNQDVAAVLAGEPGAVQACVTELERKRDQAAEATLFERASELQETIRAVEWLAQASSAGPVSD